MACVAPKDYKVTIIITVHGIFTTNRSRPSSTSCPRPLPPSPHHLLITLLVSLSLALRLSSTPPTFPSRLSYPGPSPYSSFPAFKAVLSWDFWHTHTKKKKRVSQHPVMTFFTVHIHCTLHSIYLGLLDGSLSGIPMNVVCLLFHRIPRSRKTNDVQDMKIRLQHNKKRNDRETGTKVTAQQVK
jgi:hypothetical protein